MERAFKAKEEMIFNLVDDNGFTIEEDGFVVSKDSVWYWDIYEILDDNMMNRAEIKHNCPFSYHSEKTIAEIKARRAEIEEAKRNGKKISKRKQKKIANRFDE